MCGVAGHSGNADILEFLNDSEDRTHRTEPIDPSITKICP